MYGFSSTDAALEGYRLTRENPRIVLVWAVLSFAISIVMGIVLIQFGGAELMALNQASGDADPEEVFARMQRLAPLYALLLPLGLAVPAVLAAAVYRVVLGIPGGGPGRLALGADEVRLIGLTVIYFFLAVGVAFVVALGVGLIAAAAAAVLGAAAALLAPALGVFALGVLIYIAVRLSLAPVITFAERRLAVFDSWSLTRGQFIRLLGAYLLAFASFVAVALLSVVIFAALAAVGTGFNLEEAGRAFNPDMSSIGAYFSPLTVSYLAFNAVLTALNYAVLFAPAAVAYQGLSRRMEV